MKTCQHADAGCNYPEGECAGFCATDAPDAKTVTLTLPLHLANALIDMADYGADEKLYWLDKADHGYDAEEELEARRFVVAAREAVLQASRQLG